MRDKNNEVKYLEEALRVTIIGKTILIEAKEEIWREIWQKITVIEAYVKIPGDCGKDIIESAKPEGKSISEALDKRHEDLDTVIDVVNTLEYVALEPLGLPTTDECIYSLCML